LILLDPPTKHAMTDEPTERPDNRTLARQNRLRDALRENLKRRKAQSRGRLDQTAETPGPGACGEDAAPSHQGHVGQDDA
jgi:hypothetical protein